MSPISANGKRAVTAAISFHVAATLLVFLASRWLSLAQVFPDSAKFQTQIAIAADVLRQRGFAAWFFSLLPFHVKIHSLLFAAFGGTNYSMLWAEPLNALLFLAILVLVFNLSRKVFETRTALATAIVIGVWPSFLVHTTQPLKDPIFISLALLFLIINSVWLLSEPSLKKAIGFTALGVIVLFFLWVIKSQMWVVIIGIGILTCVFLAIRMSRARRLYLINLAGALILLGVSVALPRALSPAYNSLMASAKARGVADLYRDDEAMILQAEMKNYVPPKSMIAAKIDPLRYHFIRRYPGAGSNIDTGVEFHSLADVIKYVPRAAVIGMFAPFPEMWFERGIQNGRAGRLLTGAETLVLYLFEALALVTVWQRRREVLVWWLLSIVLLGCVALGFVVTNVGALYRMRYLFVILIVILGVDGFRFIIQEIGNRRRTPSAGS